MSDEREICLREYDDEKAVLCESEIRYASKVWEQKLIIHLGNTQYPLLQWHKTLSEKALKVELDYTFLLKVSIKVMYWTSQKIRLTDMK